MTASRSTKPGRQRQKPPLALTHQLRRAPSKELHRLVSERLKDLTLQEIRQVLHNPHLTEEVIDELLLARHLLSIYEVQRAFARHRRTAETAAMRFIGGLLWRDLLEITLDVRVRPTVRRQAEKFIIQRLSRLTVAKRSLWHDEPPARWRLN